MTVSHIAYIPTSRHYRVYFVDERPLREAHERAQAVLAQYKDHLSPLDEGTGGVLQFRLLPDTPADEVLPAIVRGLRPYCPATVTKLDIRCCSYHCAEHGIIDITPTYAPGLNADHSFIPALVTQFNSAGLPAILPQQTHELPATVAEIIRRTCRRFGVFVQHIELQWEWSLGKCPSC